MVRELTRLSEHLRCGAFCKLPPEQAMECQRKLLAQFGPVLVTPLLSLSEAINFVLPLKSFTRNYLVWACGEWSFVCSDMIGEWCMVDVYAHSRITGCDAVAAVALPQVRSFCLLTNGVISRRIECAEDGDRWAFESHGTALPFEDTASLTKRIKRDRFTPAMVDSLVTRITGTRFPPVFNAAKGQAFGLQRSWKNLRVAVEEFAVTNDLLEAEARHSS